ncbi:MAG TPA: protein tyrosine phosphatase family protein [Pyrinomonadaceae bacterium]|nr:protein tyrosine phosphatase family protein [Pyrinomonadaceae bacterium]
MKPLVISILVTLLFAAHSLAVKAQNNERSDLEKIEQSLQADVPRVLCLSKGLTTGGQPSDQAFSKLAANGFRSVLNLRTASEGIDLEEQRAAVEEAGMRYLHIPVAGRAPQADQVEAFISLVKDESNHPMFIHCGTANRVGAFMMIYRVVEHEWKEDKALDEAVRIGLRSEELKKFARDYIERRSTVVPPPSR